MEVIIHRGTKEIGGTCIRLSSGHTSILLDYGKPLQKDYTPTDITDRSIDAVIISHAHQDHYGLIDQLPGAVPVYTSRLNRTLINTPCYFSGEKPYDGNFRLFRNRQTFKIGPFKITPQLIDHSSPDAYAFVIEAEGKKIFYPGDFRAHGRKGILFKKLLQHPPENVNLMFMEGTMFGRQQEKKVTEKNVENGIYNVLKNSSTLNFLIASGQNIDTIVSAYRAAVRSGKILVVDPYTAFILYSMKEVSPSMPQPDWDNIKVLHRGRGGDHKVNIMRGFQDFFGDFGIFISRADIKLIVNDLKKYPGKYILKVPDSFILPICRNLDLSGPTVIYSLWTGYLQKEYNDNYQKLTRLQRETDFHIIHSSGHALLDDLQKLAAAVKPDKLVPIHTEYAADYSDYFKNVWQMEDGVRYEL